MAGGKVEVIDSKGCSRFLVGISSSFPSLGRSHSFEPMSPASSAVSDHTVRGSGPFSGLVICVTGLSKGIKHAFQNGELEKPVLRCVIVFCLPFMNEARKQVMAATERLGGQYSSVLHPQCTHLVVQSFGGRKLEHALKHGSKNGLYVVTLGWFVDSVRRNVRLSESLYNAKSVGENGLPVGEWNQLVGFAANENSCLPSMFHEDNKAPTMTRQPHLQHSGKESSGNKGPVLASHCIYIDSNVSTEMQKKVTDAAAGEGAAILDHWFIGCRASHVVCEGPSIRRYIGHTNNLVTPLWILKTVKEKHMQRLVHMSVDLARQVGVMLENAQNCVSDQDMNRQGGAQDALNSMEPLPHRRSKQSLEKKQQIVDLAKMGVRTRRGRRMQSCQTPIRPITPSSLLESICWSISEPTSTACIYTDSSLIDDAVEQHTSEFFDARADGRDSEAPFDNFSRPLRESEKGEVIFKNHFLTILFPIDRFGEMGPSSRTFFSDSGFTCLQVLDHIYAFYQSSDGDGLLQQSEFYQQIQKAAGYGGIHKFLSSQVGEMLCFDGLNFTNEFKRLRYVEDNMSADEIDAAIHTDSRHADRLRLIYASKESVECGFVPFKRIDFLGSRRSFEMLKRVSGDNNSNVYELLIRA